MQEESKQVTKGQFVLSVGDGGSDLPDYIMLPAEEPIKVNISDIKQETSPFAEEDGSHKEQLKFSLKVAEGQDGAGQVYSKWVNAPLSSQISPKSKLFEITNKAFPNGVPEQFDVTDLLGQPLRIELGEPYEGKNGKTYQKVTAIKSPTKDQKKIEPNTGAVVAESMDEIEAEFMKAVGTDDGQV